MSVLSKAFLTLVRGHFVLLSFLSARHMMFFDFAPEPAARPSPAGILKEFWLNNYFKSFRYESTVA